MLVVVDDEPEVLRSVHDLFRLDYEVRTYERAEDALRALEGLRDAHVVMTDQRMPSMSGVELLREVRRLVPHATRLLFTGYADLQAVIAAINEGHVYRYVAKPWIAEELQAIVRQAVEQRDLLAEKARLLEELRESNRRLVEADRLKSAFIEVASHELNTPVAVVLGLAELWKMSMAEKAGPSERAWIDKIHGAGRRLAGTVERMFKLLKSERYVEPLRFEETGVTEALNRAVGEVQPFLQSRCQCVEINVGEGVDAMEADRGKLVDILVNLLGNAIKFTPDGGVINLDIRLEPFDRIRFEVTDRGEGISPGDRPHLFEPFFTGYDTMHHSSGDYQYRKKGIGLGLCLVRKFVEMHGGKVEVSSEPGRGSTFGFWIPRTQQSIADPSVAARSESA